MKPNQIRVEDQANGRTRNFAETAYATKVFGVQQSNFYLHPTTTGEHDRPPKCNRHHHGTEQHRFPFLLAVPSQSVALTPGALTNTGGVHLRTSIRFTTGRDDILRDPVYFEMLIRDIACVRAMLVKCRSGNYFF